jgi:LysM repeat protein
MEMVTYTVRPGNTVYAIAQFFGTTVKEIAEANGLNHPYTIYPGQELVIPIEDIRSPRYYVVRPGDTIVSIADRYGLEIENLLALNRLENPNIIYPGQILRLTK